MNKESYKTIQEEHNLPDYEQLQDILEEIEFDKEKETAEQLIKKITRKFVAKLEDQAGILESLLNPDHTVTSMHEAAIFSEQEREEISNAFMECMRVGREFAIIELTQQGYKEYLERLVSFWEEKKPYLLELHKKIHASWHPRKELKTDIEYLG